MPEIILPPRPRLIKTIKPVIVKDLLYDTKIQELKSLLARNGISDISRLGDLNISGNVVCEPGLLKPIARTSNYLAEVTLTRIPLIGADLDIKTLDIKVKPLKTISITNFNTQFFSSLKLSISPAVWVADTINIADDTVVVFTNASKFLTIIANAITIGRNVQFTWRQPSFENDYTRPQAAAEQAAQNQRPDRENQRIHGNDGATGRTGNNGQHGDYAPFFELYSRKLDTQNPKFLFAGQDGQNGQDGQAGQKGQNGSKGSQAQVGELLWIGLWCEQHSGSGGNGGDGGNGGKGGNGGNGGNGGKVSFYLPQQELLKLARSAYNTVLVGGRGGLAGRGGRGGTGGKGGAIGNTDEARIGQVDYIQCGSISGRIAGKDGKEGKTGGNGRIGNDGETYGDGIQMHEINEHDLILLSNSPIIENIEPANTRFFVGDTLTLIGKNFSANDKIVFNTIETNPLRFVSSEMMTVAIPKLDGGHITIRIKQSDGTYSYRISCKVYPKIQSVQQNGISPSRLKVGSKITVKGSGFSRLSKLFINDKVCPGFQFVDNETVEVIVIRPFESNQYPNAKGETVTLKLVTNTTGFASDLFPVTLDTVRMLVIGDSIAWGQGLQEHQKYHTLLQREVERRSNGAGVYKTVTAHSGSTIGFVLDSNSNLVPDPDASDHTALNGEVPTSYPTNIEQVKNFLQSAYSNDTVDIILLNGGINDINVLNILNPFTNSDDLKNQITLYCKLSMKKLLASLIIKFPKAKIILTGYYKMISDDTDTTTIKYFLAGFGMNVAGIPGLIGGIVINSIAEEKVKENCNIFYLHSKARLNEAVDETIAQNNLPANRITFIDPAYGDENAAFATTPFIFGIKIPDLTPQDNTSIAEPRRIQCVVNASRHDVNGFMCPRASTGHPNPAGAKRYFEKILESIDAIIPVG